MPIARMPVIFLPHGGGPWPFVEMGLPKHEVQALTDCLRRIPEQLPAPPKALLVISAHWEAEAPTVMTAAQPPMLFDYYGFPPASYTLSWPAPGAPELATRTQQLLRQAGFSPSADPERGFDHGTFVPLMLAWPEARVPTLQVSLLKSLDPQQHIELGRALAPLRDEGVLILGSGMSFHNMRLFRSPDRLPISKEFDDWLVDALACESAERDRRLVDWTQAPRARQVHPREEHLLPLMVAAGAAGSDPAQVTFNGTFMGVQLTAAQFG